MLLKAEATESVLTVSLTLLMVVPFLSARRVSRGAFGGVAHRDRGAPRRTIRRAATDERRSSEPFVRRTGSRVEAPWKNARASRKRLSRAPALPLRFHSASTPTA